MNKEKTIKLKGNHAIPGRGSGILTLDESGDVWASFYLYDEKEPIVVLLSKKEVIGEENENI